MSLHLEDHGFHLVRHPATINRRQRNPDLRSKLDNIATGVRFDEHRLLPVGGHSLIDLRVQQWVTPEAPLISLASRVDRPAGGYIHLPMMNLHLDEPISIGALRQALDQLVEGQQFFLMHTDRYYHVYGTTLLSEEGWRSWNLKFLMLDAIVSPRYIGHSLQQGFNLLRLNAAETLKTTVPHLAAGQQEGEGSTGLEAARAFAVARHSRQRTQGGEPYCRHLFEVEAVAGRIAREIGLPDEVVDLICRAAILHDVIEDTEADYEEVVGVAGASAADLVAALSNDKRLPKPERDPAFLREIASAPLPAHVIKLADLYSNLSGIDRQRLGGGAVNQAYLAKADRLLAALDPRLSRTGTFDACRRLLGAMRGGT